MDLRERLQVALGPTCTIERELGGGGMSRVFLVRDDALQRQVVAKVVAADLAPALRIERFRREILISATLQHAHILPVLVAGEVEGLPFYTTPFVAGDTLEHRLHHGAPLSGPEALTLLRDIAHALAYAHEQGVVHRDIKPANILLSDGAALVADFGIARTMEDARADAAGIGTPTYAAPEQFVKETAVDFRADLYAFGILAHVVLTGRAPFSGDSAQALMTAHLTADPPPLGPLRPDLPEALTSLLDQCLAKRPADRPANARELAEALDEALAALRRRVGEWSGDSLRRALALYAVASVAVGGAATFVSRSLDVPNWVLPTAIAVMAAGLPLIVLGAAAQRLGLFRLRQSLTPRRLLAGGVIAIGLLGVAVTAAVLARRAGVGVFAPMRVVAADGRRPAILVADFAASGSDTALARAIVEAVRIGLDVPGQLRIATPAAVTDAMRRMRRKPGMHLDRATALEIARRDGYPVVVDGRLSRLDRGHLLIIDLVATDSARVVRSARQPLRDDGTELAAVDRLLRKLRPVLGESYLSVRGSAPLPDVTTHDLEALQLYAAGAHALRREGDARKAIEYLEAAVEIDSTFASAWRMLGSAYNNARRGGSATTGRAVRAAYRHREHTPPLERAMIEATYIRDILLDEPATLAAMRRVVEVSDSQAFIGNLSHHLMLRGDFDEALTVAAAGLRRDPDDATARMNLMQSAIESGRFDIAEAALREFRDRLPNSPIPHRFSLYLDYNRDPVAGARRMARDSVLARADTVGDPDAPRLLATAALLLGRPAEAKAAIRRRSRRSGAPSATLGAIADSVLLSQVDLHLLRDTAAALRRLDRTLLKYGNDPAMERGYPYGLVVPLLAAAGRAPDAAALFARRERTITDTAARRQLTNVTDMMMFELALGQKRAADALAIAQSRGRIMGCHECRPLELARAHDAAGHRDSAIVWYERYLGTRSHYRLDPGQDGVRMAQVLERLSELHEQAGHDAEAIASATRLLEFWREAEPVLAPRVRRQRARVERLSARLVERESQ